MSDILMKIVCGIFIAEGIALTVMLIVEVVVQLYEHPRILVLIAAFGMIIITFVGGKFCKKITNLTNTLNATFNELTVAFNQ